MYAANALRAGSAGAPPEGGARPLRRRLSRRVLPRGRPRAHGRARAAAQGRGHLDRVGRIDRRRAALPPPEGPARERPGGRDHRRALRQHRRAPREVLPRRRQRTSARSPTRTSPRTGACGRRTTRAATGSASSTTRSSTAPPGTRRSSGPPAPREEPDGMVQIRDLLVRPVGAAAGLQSVPTTTPSGRRRRCPCSSSTRPRSTPATTGASRRCGWASTRATEKYWVEIDKNKRLATTDLGATSPRASGASSSGSPSRRRPACPGCSIRSRSAASSATDRQAARTSCASSSWTAACTTTRASGTLVDAGCEYVIASDASGQMADMDEPSTRIPASVTRSTSGIYGDRVREEQLSDVRRQPEPLRAHPPAQRACPRWSCRPCPTTSPETTTTPVMRGAARTASRRGCSSCSRRCARISTRSARSRRTLSPATATR